tara:strand:+ start:491 stop:2938 length:2448 start_codon:yes stop_codon:yes gene_type:complete
MNEAIAYNIGIAGMHCGGCVARVEKAIAGVSGVSSVHVNLATEGARIEVDRRSSMADVLAALSAAGYGPAVERFSLKIDGLGCGACVARVEKALNRLIGVREARVNLTDARADIDVVAGLITADELTTAIENAGYAAHPLAAAENASNSHRDAAAALGRDLCVAAPLTIAIALLAMGPMVPGLAALLEGWLSPAAGLALQALLCLPVQLWAGRRFYRAGVNELRHAAPGMNSLVLIGSGAAFGYSLAAWLVPGVFPPGTAHAYFDAAAMIVTLILLGRWLEARAKGRTSAAIRGLMALQAPTADVRRGAGWQTVAIEAVAVGETVRIRPGERVPVDGVVTSGASWVDESMLSGEPMPAAKSIDDALTAGTLNQAGVLEARVTQTGADTTLAGIIRLVENAQADKPAIQATADRVAGIFVPCVLGLAAATFVAWWLIGPAPALTHAFVSSVAVLLIACPCAMGLATPTAVMVATGRAARQGLLFRRGSAIERLADIDTIVFDKTGTLTQGQPALTDPIIANGFDGRDVLARAAALESASEHPVAVAIVAEARAQHLRLPAVTDVEVQAGQGIRGQVDGQTVAIGSAAWMTRLKIETHPWQATADRLAERGRTVLYVMIGDRLAGLLAVADPLRDEARHVIDTLKNAGQRVVMLTGDRRLTAEAIAGELGIDDVIAEVQPADKARQIVELQNTGARVAFVGDGINDAPALAGADVGIAIGTGTDIALDAADVVLMRAELDGVVQARHIARRTMRTIRSNFVWAYGYNIALIPLAAGVFYPWTGWLLNPAIAAGAMSLSSVFVLANSLRLRRAETRPD